eukprot:scaffold36275_cov154-Isochrysis_galbana.AAC.38
MEEKRTHASSAEEAAAKCKLHPPKALGAYTRLIVLAVCVRRRPSLSTPAACHTPARRVLPSARTAPIMRRVSTSSAASHLTTRTSQCASFFSFSPSAAATLPPRAASTTDAAPFSPTQRPVSRPRPPVPPESTCLARGGMCELTGMRTTTLPVFVPPCNVRNAARSLRSISKTWSGRPCKM